jgi:hypothetical protein
MKLTSKLCIQVLKRVKKYEKYSKEEERKVNNEGIGSIKNED